MAPQAPRSIPVGEIDPTYELALASTAPDDDGPVWMVTLVQYRDDAGDADGRPTAVAGRQADDLVAPLPFLAEVGAELVFLGDVEHHLVGDAPLWDRISVVKYPTRRSLIESHAREDVLEPRGHEDAGMDATIIIGCQPASAPSEWPPSALPSPGDRNVVLFHILALADDAPARRDHTMGGLLDTDHGGRRSGWFNVEGTIVGDGRAWHEVRFSVFPSHEALDASILDDERLAALETLEDPGILDAYALIVRPIIDNLVQSTTSGRGWVD